MMEVLPKPRSPYTMTCSLCSSMARMTDVKTSERPANRCRSLTGWEGVKDSRNFMRVRANSDPAWRDNWSPAVARNCGKGIDSARRPEARDGLGPDLSPGLILDAAASSPRPIPSHPANLLLKLKKTTFNGALHHIGTREQRLTDFL